MYQFKIFLEKDLYRPGDKLKGAVKLKVSEPFKINAIKIKLNGNANVHW